MAIAWRSRRRAVLGRPVSANQADGSLCDRGGLRIHRLIGKDLHRSCLGPQRVGRDYARARSAAPSDPLADRLRIEVGPRDVLGESQSVIQLVATGWT